MGVIVFIIKLSELGSDRSQDDAVCCRRLLIFLDQGNISKLRRRPQTFYWTRMDCQCNLCIIQVWTKLKSSNCKKKMYYKKQLPNSRFQILPSIENLVWLYIWGVVCLYAIFRNVEKPADVV